jgi:polyisoprenoid-binding protein YceI
MNKTLLCLPALVITALVAQAAEVEIYKIDSVHSSVKFSIRHFVAKTTGNFGQFEGTLKIDRADLTKSSVEATIQIPSVDTDNKKRDAHLQEDDFFNAAKHPQMTFKSTAWKATDDKDEFEVTGDLSFNGVTKPVTLDVELLGFGEGRPGVQLSGWEATATLDRTEWGVNGGQPAVGNEVDITINIEAYIE